MLNWEKLICQGVEYNSDLERSGNLLHRLIQRKKIYLKHIFLERKELRSKMSTESRESLDNDIPEQFIITRRKGGWADEGSKSAKT